MIGSSSQISTVLNKFTTLLYFVHPEIYISTFSAQTVPFSTDFGVEIKENFFALLASRDNYNLISNPPEQRNEKTYCCGDSGPSVTGSLSRL
jgi:hypothetical protein